MATTAVRLAVIEEKLDTLTKKQAELLEFVKEYSQKTETKIKELETEKADKEELKSLKNWLWGIAGTMAGMGIMLLGFLIKSKLGW